jgi:tetratricopeptide (TPR) repeat protein
MAKMAKLQTAKKDLMEEFMKFQSLSIATILFSGLTAFSSQVEATPLSVSEIAFENACMVNSEAMPQEFLPPTFTPQPLPENLDTTKAWQIVAENAAVSGDFHNAIKAFDKAIDLSDGRNPELFEQRGWIHYIQDDYQQAIVDFKAAALLYEETENTAGLWDACQLVSYVERQPV